MTVNDKNCATRTTRIRIPDVEGSGRLSVGIGQQRKREATKLLEKRLVRIDAVRANAHDFGPKLSNNREVFFKRSELRGAGGRRILLIEADDEQTAVGCASLRGPSVPVSTTSGAIGKDVTFESR